MATTTEAPAAGAPARRGTHLLRRAAALGRGPVALPGAALLVGLLAFALRWWRRDTAFDTFVDEYFYEQLGAGVRDGGLPGADGAPFFLHPPGLPYLVAGWERLVGRPDDPVAAVLLAREPNLLLGAVTAALVVLVVGRRSVRWGAGAGLLVAVDPFVLRQDARILMEVSATACLFAGLLVLLPLLDAPRRSWRAVVGGLVMGLAVVTNDKAVVLVALPLALLWLLRRRHRGWTPLAVGAAAVPYLVYLAVVVGTGHLGDFADAKLGGVRRLLGLDVTTGFNAPGAPSLSGQLVGQLADFGTTYALLALAVPASALLLWRGDDTDRLLGLVHVSAFALLGYSAVGGTLEEHFLYYLLVPSLVVVPSALALVARGALGGPFHRERELRRAAAVAGVVGLLVVAVADAGTYARWHRDPDDGFRQVRAYLVEHLPAGAGVVSVQGGTEFALGDRYDVGPWVTPQDRRAHDATYLVVPWREAEQGYTYVSYDDVRALAAQGRPVLDLPSRTYGRMTVYLLPPG
jgi:hypothetical protein